MTAALPYLPGPVVVLLGLCLIALCCVAVGVMATNRWPGQPKTQQHMFACPHCAWRFSRADLLADHLEADHPDA